MGLNLEEWKTEGDCKILLLKLKLVRDCVVVLQDAHMMVFELVAKFGVFFLIHCDFSVESVKPPLGIWPLFDEAWIVKDILSVKYLMA